MKIKWNEGCKAVWPVVMVLFILGCSGDASAPSGQLTLQHDDAQTSQLQSAGGDVVDTVEIVGYDAVGNQIYGPVQEPYGWKIVRNDLPRNVKSITVDYLRNRGFPLMVTSFAADFEDDGVHLQSNPALSPHETPRSVWTSQMDGPCRIKLNGACFIIKGVCYSPSPVGYNAKDFPALGDLFWDSFPKDNPTTWNWYSLWGSQYMQGSPYPTPRNDLQTIRNLNANAIRVYAMMSRQPTEVPNTNPKQYDFSNATGKTKFTHQVFLDECYNNGNNPVYVLIGIPLPEPIFRNTVPFTHAQEEQYWNTVVDEITKDLASHPAVLGFTIMNELDAVPWALNSSPTAHAASTDYFYGQAVKYAKLVKSNASDKLVGWALHDNPPLLKFASENKFTTGAYIHQAYLDVLAANFDYWGVNTYQKENYQTVLGQPGSGDGKSYQEIPASARKPVIFTEVGWPATGRDGSGNMMYAQTTGDATALWINRMLPQDFGQYKDLFAGAFYFEFSDEWWKNDQRENDRYVWNIDRTLGREDAWPNGYNDQEGYGLYGLQLGEGRQQNPWCGSGPCLPPDTLLVRQPLIDALSKIYATY